MSGLATSPFPSKIPKTTAPKHMPATPRNHPPTSLSLFRAVLGMAETFAIADRLTGISMVNELDLVGIRKAIFQMETPLRLAEE